MRASATLYLTISVVAIGAVPALATPVVHSFDGTPMEIPTDGREVIEPASSELSARVLAESSQSSDSLEENAGIVLLVRSTGEEGVTPTDSDNDYTPLCQGSCRISR